MRPVLAGDTASHRKHHQHQQACCYTVYWNQECVGGVRIKHPKHVVIAVVVTGVALGLVLILTGISFVLGCLIVLGFSALVWGPVLAAFVLVVIPALWRDRFGPPR